MKIGPKIKKIRELRGFKQEDVAHQLGIHQTTYSRMEKEIGKDKVTIDTLSRIAEVLGVDPIDILNFDEKFIFNTQEQKASQSGSLSLNHFSEKIQTLYEARIKSLEEEISFLRALLEKAKYQI